MAALSPAQRSFLLALAPRFVPGAAALTPDEAQAGLDLIDEALADRPARVRRQFALLLAVLRWSPLVRHGHRLDTLPPAQQAVVLRWFENAPIQKLRAGFWGLRTLIFIGYYGRPAIGSAIGYRPSRDGNALLHARTAR